MASAPPERIGLPLGVLHRAETAIEFEMVFTDHSLESIEPIIEPVIDPPERKQDQAAEDGDVCRDNVAREPGKAQSHARATLIRTGMIWSIVLEKH